MQPNPVEIQLAQLPQEMSQLMLPRQVRAVPGDILRNDDQFLYAPIRKAPGLFQQMLHGAAAVLAPQGGDHAVGAVIVAALRYAQIRIPWRRGQHPVPLLLRRVDTAEAAGPLPGHHRIHGGGNLAVASGSQNAVHLG
ncbi:hypothetical protein SDC9_199852 [bioreactor metagenome]|uniref:Uncharacterized protein n=1 Tax=bioreactor metagenome TaxID=1076179 RepID=A0A645IMC4_9ZZZZ